MRTNNSKQEASIQFSIGSIDLSGCLNQFRLDYINPLKQYVYLLNSLVVWLILVNTFPLKVLLKRMYEFYDMW